MAKKNTDKAQLDLIKQAETSAKSLGASEEQVAELQREILNLRIRSHAQLLQELKAVQNMATAEKTRVKASKEVLDIEEDLASVYSSLLKDKYKIAGSSKQELNLSKQVVAKKEEELAAIESLSDYDKERVATLKGQISLSKALIEDAEKLQNKFGATNLSMLNDGFDDLQSKISNVTKFLPKGLSSALGVDTLADDLKGAVLEGNKIPAGFGLAAIAGIGAIAFSYLKDITNQAKEFSTATGLSVASSQQLVEQSLRLETSVNNQLSSQKDILSVQEEIVRQLGPMNQLSEQVALQVADTGKAFGYGAKTAGQVQSQLMQISGLSETAAIQAQEFTAQMALAEGVAPGQVMQDIARSSKTAAKYFAGNPEALGAAAIEAAKLGLSLDKMAGTAEALLKIESSLEDQFVASAMLGRQLNFDAARRAAAEGDIATATKEVLNQLGSIEDFENASVFAKQRMAAAAGMEVDELSKSLALQARSSELTADELKAVNGLNLSAEEIKKLSAGELKNKLADAQVTEQLSASMDKIASTMSTIILPIAQLLTPVFEGIAAAVGYIVEGFQFLKPILPVVLTTLGLIYAKTIGIAIGNAIALAYSSFMSMGPLGIVLGSAAALAAVGFVKSKMNDGVMEPVTPSGYSRTITGPEGSIAINDRDTIVAGTDLNSGGGTTVAIDYDKLGTAVAKAIQNLKIIIDESAVGAINKRGALAASYR